MSRAINLALFVCGLLLIAVSVALAPEFFGWGGYIQKALVHVGDVIGAVIVFTAGRHLLRD